MKAGNRSIGPNEPPLVIAEIGINRGGGLGVTKNMVDLIASSCLLYTSDAADE